MDKKKVKKNSTKTVNKIDFSILSIKELYKIAEKNNIKNYNSMTENDLIDKFKKIKRLDLNCLTVKELKLLAKSNNIKKYYKKNKNDLILSLNSLNLKKRSKFYILYIVIYLIILNTLLVVILNSFFSIFEWQKDNEKNEEILDSVIEDVKINKIDEEGDLINSPDDIKDPYWDYIKLPFYDVDIKELKKKNKDTVGFIHVKNTNINYPVVKTTNNEFYLTHSFDKSKNTGGWVFMDYENSINPLSDNTVIYGHNRKNNTMFSTLNNTLTKEWQSNDDNYVIWLSTEKENLLFQIFSIYTIKSESYYITTNFNTIKEKQAWINTMKKRNIAPIKTSVNANDTILTLSTCNKNNNKMRVVVHAKLIKRLEKNPNN